jgi:hypothetical protein
MELRRNVNRKIAKRAGESLNKFKLSKNKAFGKDIASCCHKWQQRFYLQVIRIGKGWS